jgi:alpha-glucosidase
MAPTSTQNRTFFVQNVSPRTQRIWHDPSGEFTRFPDPALTDELRERLESTDSTHEPNRHPIADLQMSVVDGVVRISGQLATDERVYGAYDAEARSLNRRGDHVHLISDMHKLGKPTVQFDCAWCDAAEPHPALLDFDLVPDSQYGGIMSPWFVSSAGYAVYVSNMTAFGVLDFDCTDDGRWTFAAPGGAADIYVVTGDMPTALAELAQLTGHQPLPPAWTLGYIQSRFGYESFDHAISVLDRFHEEQLPVHGLVFDVQWLEQYVNLKWNPQGFDRPEARMREIAEHSTGARTIVITEPGTRSDTPNFADGDANDAFARNADGTLFDSNQWYSGDGILGFTVATKVDGALVNFYEEKAADWWYEQHLHLLEEGVDGWWTDLNEPEGCGTDMVFPRTNWPADSTNMTGVDLRNTFALAQVRAFHDRDRKHSSRRPFVLSRAATIGAQRYGAFPWSADVGATWSDFQHQPLLGLLSGMCGLPMWGCDLGGFHGSPDAELFARWLQMGAFMPTFRAHGMLADREPWAFGDEALAAIRPSLTLRAQLLPSLMSWTQQALASGQPLMTPQFLAYPDDDRFANTTDQWLFGPLLVAPVLERGAATRTVVLPEGRWHDLWTGDVHEGGGSIELDVTLNSTPVFVPEGTLLLVDPEPLSRRARNWPVESLEAWAYGEHTTGRVYLDDGITRAHEAGAFGVFEVSTAGDGVSIARTHGDWSTPTVQLTAPHPGAL